MIKHRNKLIMVVGILVILSISWMLGGNYAVRDSRPSPTPTTTVTPEQSPYLPPPTPKIAPEISPTSDQPIKPKTVSPSPEPIISPSPTVETQTSPHPQTAENQPSNYETLEDKYDTNDTILVEEPIPTELQDLNIGTMENACTLSVRCDTILNNMDSFDKEKADLVPSDGVVFNETTVTFYEGESVFNVLQREMKRARIHMSFRNTPIYNSTYIEAINNLYEFDCGELSGWMYKVNGWFPNYGSSRYQLKPGDVVEWVYTCDLGNDVGGGYASGDLQ